MTSLLTADRRFPFLVALFLVAMLPGKAMAGDVTKGRDLSLEHCARCHVVDPDQSYGGINSTPSFKLLASLGDYLERFETFYARRPHPVFVRVEGFEPLTNVLSPVATFEIRLEDIEDLIAYVETMRD